MNRFKLLSTTLFLFLSSCGDTYVLPDGSPLPTFGGTRPSTLIGWADAHPIGAFFSLVAVVFALGLLLVGLAALLEFFVKMRGRTREVKLETLKEKNRAKERMTELETEAMRSSHEAS